MHKGSRKKSFLQIAALLLAIVFIVSVVFVIGNFLEKNSGLYSGEEEDATETILEFNDRKYVLKDNVETFLVMGLDAREEIVQEESYNNNRSADFLLLLIMDHQERSISALEINRDTLAEMNILGVAGEKIGTVEKQIALAHTYGNGKEVSCRNVANAVTKLLGGISVEHYASVTMDAVPMLTDLVGGVEVTLREDFTYLDPSYEIGKTVLLKGEAALEYVRGRYGLEIPTNEARMKRQQEFLSALAEKMMLSIDKEGFSADFALKISKYMVSDCSANQLELLMNKVSAYESLGIKEIKGESVVVEGYMQFHPDEEALKQKVVELFYQIQE